MEIKKRATHVFISYINSWIQPYNITYIIRVILQSVLDQTLEIDAYSIRFSWKKNIFKNKIICLPTDPIFFGHATGNKHIFF